MDKLFATALMVATTLYGFSSVSNAKDLGDSYLSKERFQVRVRALAVLPDDSSSVNIGGETDVGDFITPEVDLTYFITENIAVEAIAGTAQHQVYYNGSTNLGDVWILPPTVTLQYHFMPDNKFSPYLGAGVNYSFFYGEQSGNGFTDFKVDGGFGLALQAGFDYWLNDNWGVNLDVKKIYVDIEGELNNGTIQADIDLDPWVFGAGVSYRF